MASTSSPQHPESKPVRSLDKRLRDAVGAGERAVFNALTSPPFNLKPADAARFGGEIPRRSFADYEAAVKRIGREVRQAEAANAALAKDGTLGRRGHARLVGSKLAKAVIANAVHGTIGAVKGINPDVDGWSLRVNKIRQQALQSFTSDLENLVVNGEDMVAEYATKNELAPYSADVLDGFDEEMKSAMDTFRDLSSLADQGSGLTKLSIRRSVALQLREAVSAVGRPVPLRFELDVATKNFRAIGVLKKNRDMLQVLNIGRATALHEIRTVAASLPADSPEVLAATVDGELDAEQFEALVRQGKQREQAQQQDQSEADQTLDLGPIK